VLQPEPRSTTESAITVNVEPIDDRSIDDDTRNRDCSRKAGEAT
jgi:hypothetical protein